MKFNTTEKTVDGTKFVFVTRGRSKQFSKLEVNEFLKERLSSDTWPTDVDCESVVPIASIKIRDELVSMFLKDMRQFGVAHCVKKYGGTPKNIIAEAARVAPYMTQGFKE